MGLRVDAVSEKDQGSRDARPGVLWVAGHHLFKINGLGENSRETPEFPESGAANQRGQPSHTWADSGGEKTGPRSRGSNPHHSVFLRRSLGGRQMGLRTDFIQSKRSEEGKPGKRNGKGRGSRWKGELGCRKVTKS